MMEKDKTNDITNNNLNENSAKKLLLVDDDLNFLEILETKLKRENFEIDKANNGNECLEKVNQKNYDLIVLDVMMPEFDGIDIVLSLLKNYPDRKFKFIFLTNFGEENPLVDKNIDEEYAKQIGATAFISKLEDLDSIISKIKKIINES